MIYHLALQAVLNRLKEIQKVIIYLKITLIPFNPTTKIEYSIPEATFVQLKVYDILGNEVATLVNEEQSAGTYRAEFNGEELASGLYIAQLKAGNYSKTIKMSLLK